MQTSPLYSTGAALLGDYTTAGQFQVVDGQLVQLVSAPGEAVKLLYGVVSETRYINDNSLSVTFSTSKNTYGTFAWQGDGLTWTVAGVSRPNASAWYVCTGQQLYINLGNYEVLDDRLNSLKIYPRGISTSYVRTCVCFSACSSLSTWCFHQSHDVSRFDLRSDGTFQQITYISRRRVVRTRRFITTMTRRRTISIERDCDE
jgi:hypothetical protein